MPSNSLFRRPGVQHFQLVHRSQRDPLIHDPDAPQHVLRAVVRPNDKKVSRADLEVIKQDVRPNVGQAALYGIYFDDTEYDYMQHLRAVGTEEEGVESILIEAPPSRIKSRSKGGNGPFQLSDLPAEAFPSETELPRDFETQQAVPSSIAGFQPDMDPHLRQTLEALEDDAFVDDETQDDFFAELVCDGERDGEDVDYEFYEYGPPSKAGNDDREEDECWEAKFAKFKKDQVNSPPPPDSDDGDYSDGGDTVGNLPTLPVIGGKRRRRGTSDASGYSMSSSSMYRTEALLTLDERFDQLMVKEYGSDEDVLDKDGLETASTSSSSSAPDLVTSREDYAEIIDKFMDEYELLGRKLKPVLAGGSSIDKLETLRRALGQDERVRVATMGDEEEKELDDDEVFKAYNANEKEERWDCETILTTYSNMENHPRIIQARSSKSVPKIKLDPRTGLPSIAGDGVKKDQAPNPVEGAKRVTISRPRDESKEDKKVRKQANKAERQARRIDKKTMRERFSSEIKQQAQELSNKTSMSRTRKL